MNVLQLKWARGEYKIKTDLGEDEWTLQATLTGAIHE